MSDDARALREKHGIGLMEAQRILKGERLRQLVSEAQDLSAIKVVLQQILIELYPPRPKG